MFRFINLIAFIFVAQSNLASQQTLCDEPFILPESLPVFRECEDYTSADQERCNAQIIANYIWDFLTQKEIDLIPLEGIVIRVDVNERGQISNKEVLTRLESKLERLIKRAISPLPDMQPGMHKGNYACISMQFDISKDQILGNENISYAVDTSINRLPRFYDQKCELLLNEKERNNCAVSQFLTYVYTNLRYPAEAKENGIEGIVRVEYVVDSLGYLKNIKVRDGLGYGLDEESIRILESSPQPWLPGLNNGKYMNVPMVLPVKFGRN